MKIKAKLLFRESMGLAGHLLSGLVLLAAVTGTAFAQTPVAVDDAYSAASGFLLQIGEPGVMENDHDGDGEPPPSGTPVAHLVSGASSGTLVLFGDGSFDYTSNVGFSGVDTFTYYFVNAIGTSNTATVSITVDGCEPGVAPTQWVCWVEEAYLAKAAELGLSTFVEGFEDDVTWAAAREPETIPSVISQSVTWTANLATNNVATGDGPQHSGGYAFFSLPHGDLVGDPGDRTHDGFIGTGASPNSMLGVGSWLVSSQVGARIDFIITHDGGATTIPGFPDHTLSYTHRFFGFIDTAGFTSFEVVETDGTVNQPFFIFGDDFSFITSGADAVPPRVVEIGSWEETADGVITESEVIDVDISELLVRFSEPVQDPPGDSDPDDVTNPANYLLFDDGGDGFDTIDCAGGISGNDTPIAVEVWQYLSGEPSETWLGINDGVGLPIGAYRLMVCGTTSIVDWAGNVLDGDGNGTGGDDFVRNFEVTAPVNHAPTADPQSVSTAEDTGLGITLTGSDPDGDAISFAIDTGPTHGAVTGTPPSVIYTPGPNYFGPDSFTYTAADATLTSPPATVSITVTPVNDRPTADDQSVSTLEDTAKAITLTGGDVDGDSLTFVLGTGPTHGGLTGTPPNVTYTPDSDYSGPDSFTFTTTDTVLISTIATVSITVTPVNDIPLAAADSATTDEDVAISISVLGNDALGDPPTTITAVTQGTSGAVTIDPGATTVTYTPNADTNGADSFTYTITDADMETSIATVSMTVTPVNDVPLAAADSATTDEDVAISISVLGNDALGDPPTTITAVSQGTSGSVTIDPGATSVTYTPDPNTNGLDSFSYTITDLDLETSIATVSMTVTPVNDIPQAAADSATTDEDVAISIAVLVNDDLGDEPTTITAVTQGTNGAVTIDPGATSVTYTPTADTNGPDSFTYTITDADLETSIATVSMTVTPVNDIPLAAADSATTDEDVAISIAVLGNDALGDEPTTITAVTQGTNGAVTIDPGATSVSYTPDPNTHGLDSFNYTITDADLETSIATVSMTVTPVNDIPLAAADSATTDEDVAISIAVLGNDALGDEPTTITAVTQGTNGSVTIDPGATTLTYTPNADTNGADSFTYTITDLDLQTSIATVSMTVTPINDAPVADAGPAQTVFVTDTVTLDGSGSSDVDGDALTYAWSFFSIPAGSTAALSSLTAAMPTFVVDEPGDYVVDLIVSDGTLFSLVDTVTISTDNSPPVADAGLDQSAFVTDTVFLDGTGSSDVDGDPLTYDWSFFSFPAGSTATLSDTTAEMPTFVVDLPGTYVVQLIVHDGTVSSAPDTVAISTDNTAPVADAGPDQSALVTDTVTLDGTGSSDADGDPLEYAWSFSSFPAGSTATLSSLTAEMPTFVIDLPGIYVVQLIVNDGTVSSAPDTVAISTDNSVPTADPQSVSTAEDTGLGITLTGSDPDGDAISFAIDTGPTHGAVTGTPPSVIYTPGPNYFGPDSFTYTAADATLTSPPATVSITVTPVNDRPTADDQSVSTLEDTAKAITLTGGDVDGDSLTFVLGTGPTHGGLTGTPPNVTYTPDSDYSGPDSFTFTTTDTVLISTIATVSITVTPVNDIPLAAADSATTDEDVAISISVLGNDALGDPPTTITAVTQGTSGAVTIDPGATTVTYTPNADTNGADSFTYTITDADMETSIATVSMTVTPVNDVPLAAADSATTDEDVAISISVLGNDALGDEPTTITAVTQGTNGAVTIDPGATTLTYTPTADTNGADSFTYTITDSDMETSIATVSMTVTPINDVPLAAADSATTDEDVAISISVLGNDALGDEPTTITAVTQGTNGSVTIDPGATTVTYTPTADTNGADSFTYTITDADLETSTATVSMTVNGINDAPVADPQSVSTPEDTGVAITLTGSDPDGDSITFEVVTGPTHGALTGTPPNLTYTPDGGYAGPDSFVFRTFDGSLYSEPATISVTVTPAALPVLTIGDASIDEPDSGTAVVTVVISVSAPSPVSIAVDFATADGTAVAGSDYVAASGTLTIPALATSYDLVLDVTGDLVNELEETFSVSLSNPVGAVLGTPSTGTVTIVDNDPWTWFVATDGNDANDCLTTTTACLTISEAVARAAAGDLVNVARGVYLEHLVLNVNLTLVGEFRKGTVIDGGGSGIVIDISPATTVIMSHFEITGGAIGGVANQGDLTLGDSWIHDNGDGSPASYGGLSNLGTALIDRVAITANLGDAVGGVSNAGDLQIRNSTISGNGAGIENLPGATLELHYSTVAANGTHGILVGGTVSLRGSIVAGHSTANCDASVVTLGHNLEDADSCGLQLGAGDLIGVDALLAPLGDNGGSSPTHALAIKSPAIDAAEIAGSPATDQRGVARPIDGNLDGTAESDIGAFEFIPGIIFGDGFESGDTSAWGG